MSQNDPNGLEYAKKLIAINLRTQDPYLDLVDCGLNDISELSELWDCQHLIGLSMGTNYCGQTEYIPPKNLFKKNEIGNEGAIAIAQNLKNLTHLHLDGNQIAHKGAISITQNLRNLISLHLSNNQIGVEGAIAIAQNLKSLTSLHLHSNLIGNEGAVAIAQNLKKLTYLQLSNNQVGDEGMKAIVQNLVKLTSLHLHSNQIGNEGIKVISQNLKNLKFLFIGGNQITDITALLPFLKQQNRYIHFEANPITTPPEEVWKQGRTAIINYFYRIEKEKEVDLNPFINKEVKLILAGNSHAGKSTLAKYLIEDKVDKNLASTHWMEIKEWTQPFGDHHKIDNIRIFDFGGQEYYHDTHYLFFTNNTAYVLLWDKDGNTLQELKFNQKKRDGSESEASVQCYPLEYWLDAVGHFTKVKHEEIPPEGKEWNDEYRMLPEETEEKTIHRLEETNKWIEQSKPSLLLVQNKLDVGIPKKLPLDKYEKEYKSIDIFDSTAISLHEHRFLDSLKISLEAMLGSMNIIQKEFQGTYGIIKDRLKTYNGRISVSLNEFKDLCNKWIDEKGKKDGKDYTSLYFEYTDADICARVFNMLGYILYYPESNIKVSSRIFIDQNKITNSIYEILKPALHSLGTIKKKNAILEIPEDELNDIFALMQHFRILFLHPDQDNHPNTYIAPLYLPSEPTRGISFFLSSFQKPIYKIEYKGFIHKSVVLEFFQEYGQHVLKEKNLHHEDIFYFWRKGIVIKKQNENGYEEVVMVRFFDGKDEETDDGQHIKIPAHIDIFALNAHTKSKLAEEVRTKLQEINKGWSVTEKVTLDGNTFISLDEILEREDKKQYLWYGDDGTKYELHQFKQYLINPLPMRKVFISYSKSDKHYRDEIEKHLSVQRRNGTISIWTDRELLPGEKWDGKIQQELKEADIILFLVSSDFLATDYIWDVEIQCALDRDKDPNDKVSVVPIILRKCDWTDSQLGQFHSPLKGNDISTASDKDEAIFGIVEELKKIMKS